MSRTGTTDTGMMAQWREMKSRHPNAILLYRVGDFYETFYEDAEVASRALGLTLTSRNNGGASDVPLAGVPARALNEYVRRLVQQGYRVAVCEQVEDPKLAKGIVRREVVETITPGAAFADDLLDGARNNFVVAVLSGLGTRDSGLGTGEPLVGVAAADVSTGEFRLTATPARELDALLARFQPREMLIPAGRPPSPESRVPSPDGALVTERDAWEFDADLARDDLARQFRVHSLEGLGIGAADAPALGAAGALLRYLRELQPAGLPHLARPVVERTGGTMPLDEMTRRNLELVESLRGGGSEGTLLAVLDRTLTPMGTRLLRQWLLAPLTDRAAAESRLEAVDALLHDAVSRDALRSALDGVRDVERLASKAAAGRSTPRELGALGASLSRLPAVEGVLKTLVGENGPRSSTRTSQLQTILDAWDACADATQWIADALVPNAPAQIGEEPTIAPGIDRGLDELRALRDGGKDAIARIQQEERDRTGIGSLKVGFNRVFGYFIEVTNSNLHLVPPDYQRRQTLANGERFVTPALKEYEERVLTAAERIETRERELYEALRARVGGEIARLQCAARLVAELDVLASFAEVAAREGYVRPRLVDGFDLDIVGGRHPVVERMMPREKFIPNDVRLVEDARMIILTGPNMAGKSTILRQIGLIVLLAQTGSFVPASSATIGMVDRVFTRVGASDNLVRGQSTFMVEMAETSAILHTAGPRSLVLLDEIGRGTSTYDGVSIAWAVSEHLHERTRCKTVFATHYHELVQLADELPHLRNFNVAVREVTDPQAGPPQVLFLHRLQPGGADRSYGIEVGRLAGLPDAVIARAREVLTLLEGEQIVAGLGTRDSGVGSRKRAPERPAVAGAPVPSPDAFQLALFGAPLPHPVVERLKAIDANALTPMQALALLAELSAEARG